MQTIIPTKKTDKETGRHRGQKLEPIIYETDHHSSLLSSLYWISQESVHESFKA